MPVLVMVALPAVLVVKKLMFASKPVLVMTALPAVLVCKKLMWSLLMTVALPVFCCLNKMLPPPPRGCCPLLLVMAALPAVLVCCEIDDAAVGIEGGVGDGGAAGRAGVVESDDAVAAPMLLVMVAPPAVLVSGELDAVAVADAGAARRCWHNSIFERNWMPVSLVMVALPPLVTMPAPVKVTDWVLVKV